MKSDLQLVSTTDTRIAAEWANEDGLGDWLAGIIEKNEPDVYVLGRACDGKRHTIITGHLSIAEQQSSLVAMRTKSNDLARALIEKYKGEIRAKGGVFVS